MKLREAETLTAVELMALCLISAVIVATAVVGVFFGTGPLVAAIVAVLLLGGIVFWLANRKSSANAARRGGPNQE